MEENSDTTAKSTPNHQSDDANQLPTTPGAAHTKIPVDLSGVEGSFTPVNTNNVINRLKTPPRPMENVVIQNVPTPEMVRRPPITTASEMRFEEGYDSDEAIGPFYDAIENEGDHQLEEIDVPEIGPNEKIDGNDEIAPASISEAATEAPPLPLPAPLPPLPPVIAHIEIKPEIVEKLKVDELRHELKLRSQPVRGKKDELKVRLLKALSDKIPVSVSANKAGDAGAKGKKGGGGKKKKDTVKSNVGRGFPLSAKWRPLLPDTETVSEPLNPTFKLPRAPTITEQDAEFVPPKYNFSDYKFSIPKFTGRIEKEKVGRKKKKEVLPSKRRFEKVPQKEGYFKMDVIEKYKLTTRSKPHEFVEVYFPFAKKIAKKPGNSVAKEMFSIELITKWTNSKAIMNGAGDTTYKDFKAFTREEIRRHLGIYILQGVAPSPKVEFKFASHMKDMIHGNDMVNNAFGPNAIARHKQFKAFFALQNPCIPTPPRKEYLNWKVKPLITWMNYIGPRAYKPGIHVSVDEMTM